MNKKIKKLEKWSLVAIGRPYDAPESYWHCLQGINEAGSQVVTSSIVGCQNSHVLTKSGSIYELGEADPDYEKLYPNAKKRLFERLEKFQT